jgi:hypothetical protein
MNNKIEIWQQKIKNREESFWYDGIIANIENYYLIATGEIRVTFPNGHYDNDKRAVEYATDLKFEDKDLEKLQWHNNNWFEIVLGETDENKKLHIIDCELGDVAFTYDEGIEMLRLYHKEKTFERSKK